VRHSENALQVAKFLESHPAVEWVSYPGLEDHPQYDLARKYFTHGYGAILGFGIKGGHNTWTHQPEWHYLYSHSKAITGNQLSSEVH
jgi:O-acetylhomoserine (thiol)-lyase